MNFFHWTLNELKTLCHRCDVRMLCVRWCENVICKQWWMILYEIAIQQPGIKWNLLVKTIPLGRNPETHIGKEGRIRKHTTIENHKYCRGRRELADRILQVRWKNTKREEKDAGKMKKWQTVLKRWTNDLGVEIKWMKPGREGEGNSQNCIRFEIRRGLQRLEREKVEMFVIFCRVKKKKQIFLLSHLCCFLTLTLAHTHRQRETHGHENVVVWNDNAWGLKSVFIE